MRIILNIDGEARARFAPLALLLLLCAPGRALAAAAPGPAPGEEMAIGTVFTAAEAGQPEHGKAFAGDATPVEPGRVEVEVAYAPAWWATAGAVDRISGEQHTLAAAVGVGIARDLDARVVVGWSLVHAAPSTPGAPAHGQGPSDTTVAARWRFLSLAEPALDVAVSLAVTVPTGVHATADHLGTGKESWSLGGSLAASADWGRFTGGAELAFSAPWAPGTANDVGLLACNAAVGYQVLPWLQPELELNYQHEIELGSQPDERVLWATAAAVLPVDPVRIVLGARIPVWARDAAVGPTATAALKVAF